MNSNETFDIVTTEVKMLTYIRGYVKILISSNVQKIIENASVSLPLAPLITRQRCTSLAEFLFL